LHLARIPWLDISITAASFFWHEIIWQVLLAARQIVWEVQEIRVVAQLLEQPNGLERLATLASKQTLNF
jgi:hypothetical protein